MKAKDVTKVVKLEGSPELWVSFASLAKGLGMDLRTAWTTWCQLHHQRTFVSVAIDAGNGWFGETRMNGKLADGNYFGGGDASSFMQLVANGKVFIKATQCSFDS